MAIKVHYFVTIDPDRSAEVIRILRNSHKLNVNPTEDIENRDADLLTCWKVFADNNYTEIINKMRNIGTIRGVKCYTVSIDPAEKEEENEVPKQPLYKHPLIGWGLIAVLNIVNVAVVIFTSKPEPSFSDYLSGAIVPSISIFGTTVYVKYFSN